MAVVLPAPGIPVMHMISLEEDNPLPARQDIQISIFKHKEMFWTLPLAISNPFCCFGCQIMRLFVALQLKDEVVRARLAEYEKELEKTGADIRLVAPQLFHITLKFIGEVPDNQVEKIAESLEQVKGKNFIVNFDRVGAFPSLRRINVVWAGSSRDSHELEKLGEEVNKITHGIGEDQTTFKPHVTLARVKSGRNIESLRQLLVSSTIQFGEVEFSEFQLKRSVLTPSGPVYSDVRVYSLVS